MITESIKTRTMLKKQMVCSYDEFSVNSYMNRIIKTTMELLLRSDINKGRKKDLRKLLVFFDDVESLDPFSINWELHYNRNNQTYRMLISVCYLVIKGLLQTNSDGTMRLLDFLDEQRMCHLYEKFILEYYRREFPQIEASASQIPWAVDDGITTMLPIMQSDIMLSYQGKVLIIDAKYYIHDSHDAIVSPETFELVQKELARRAGRHGRFYDSPFTGKIICGDCGGLYGHRVWHSNENFRREIWLCNEKYDNGTVCKTPAIADVEIKQTFLIAINRITDRTVYCDAYEREILPLIGVTTELEDKLRRLTVEHNDAVVDIERLVL